MLKNVKWFFVVLVFSSFISLSFDMRTTQTEKLPLGEQAPELVLGKEKQPLSLQAAKGNYILLSFWASYDAASRTRNARLHNVVSDDARVEMISISFDRYQSVFNAAVRQDGISDNVYQEMEGENSEIFKSYDLKHGFINYLVNDRGAIVAKNVTPSELASLLHQVVNCCPPFVVEDIVFFKKQRDFKSDRFCTDLKSLFFMRSRQDSAVISLAFYFQLIQYAAHLFVSSDAGRNQRQAQTVLNHSHHAEHGFHSGRVAVDKQHGVGARLPPSNIGALLGRKIQGKAKIAGDDEIVVTRQTIPKIPVAQLLHVEAAENIDRHIDRHRITTSLQVASPHSARLLS